MIAEDPEGPRIVAGMQPVREAIRAHGAALVEVLIEAKAIPRLDALARYAADQNIAVSRVPGAKLDAMSAGVRHQGAVALAPPLVLAALGELVPSGSTLLLVLDGITDPQNFGASLRSAVAFGADGVVWGEHHAAPLTPATFRASAGAVEHARLYRVRALRDALMSLAERGVTTVALDTSAEVPLASVDLRGDVALVIGAEDKGVSRGVRKICTTAARLPMTGRIDSLNASVAAALALYEARRQRG